MKIPAEVHLDVKVPVVAKAWVEIREEKDSKVVALAKALGGPSSLQVPFLCWERKGKERVRVDPEKAYIKLAEICLANNIEGFLCDYYQTVGPLFNRQEMQLPHVIRRVWLMALLAVIEDSISPFRVPAWEHWFPQGILDGETPQGEERYWTWIPLSVPKADGTGQAVTFRPLLHPVSGSWSVFKRPETKLSTREEIISYLRKNLRLNTLLRLKNINPIFNKEGTIIIRPDCLYNTILLMIHLYYNPLKHPRAETTKLKQKVLGVFRSRKNRGAISLAAHEAAKKAINRAWEEGIRDEEELIRIGESNEEYAL